MVEPVEIEHLALVYADDSRVKALATEHPNCGPSKSLSGTC